MKKEENSSAFILAEAIRRGDREAMTTLYERTSPQIWRTIRSMVRDEELAKDVQQETYLHAFTHIDQLREPEKLESWLRSIAVNQAKNALTKKTPLLFSELSALDLESELPDESPVASPEQELEDRERAALVSEVLSELADGQRLIVGMYYYEQLSVREISQRTGLSRGAVTSQLLRGRRRIEKKLAKLRKRGVTLFSVGFFPLFLREWRRTGSAAQSVVEKLPTQLSVCSKSSMLLSRIGATAAVLCMLGIGVLGAGRLTAYRMEYGEMRPTETVLQSEETFPKPVRPPAKPEQDEPAAASGTVPDEPAPEPPGDADTQTISHEKFTPADSEPAAPTVPSPESSESADAPDAPAVPEWTPPQIQSFDMDFGLEPYATIPAAGGTIPIIGLYPFQETP